MTYQESSDLMRDPVFIGRVKVSGLKFSTYIQGEDANTQGHSARYRWAQKMSQYPDQEAQQITPMVVMDAQVQIDGAEITDEALQTSVEAVVGKLV